MITDGDDYHYRLKVVVLGDCRSGKTAFLDSKDIFNISYDSEYWKSY